MKSIIFKILFWFFSIFILVIIVNYFGFEKILVVVNEANIYVMLFLLLLQVLTLLLNAYQWFYLLRLKTNNIKFLDVFVIYLTGNFVESITPSAKIGGEASKIFLFRKKTNLKYSDLSAIIVLQKYVTMLPFILIMAFILFTSLFLNYYLPDYIYYFFLYLLLFILLIFIMLKTYNKYSQNFINFTNYKPKFLNRLVIIFNKLNSFIIETLSSVKVILNDSKLFFLLAISFFIWILYPVKLFIVSNMLGFRTNIFFIFIVTFAAYLIGILPLTPGGLVGFESTVAVLFSLNGYYFTDGMSVALLTRFVTYWFPIFITVPIIFYSKIYKQ